jgi:hypothetical protein
MPSKQSNTLPIAGVASIAVAAAALVFTHDVPYLDTRPAENHYAMYDLTALEQVDARLWQDPFTAVDEFEVKESARVKFDADSQRDQAARSGIPAATVTLLTAASGIPNTPPSAPAFTRARYGKQIGDLIARIRKLAIPTSTQLPAESALTILAVTMAGNSSIGAEEARRRERYAVVSALGAADFAPTDDEHIGYVVLHYRDGNLETAEPEGASDGKESVATSKSADGDTSFRLPFEIFDSVAKSGHEPARHVMVWWVDDAALSAITRSRNWLKEIGKLLKRLAPCGKEYDIPCTVRIIGPSSSDEYAMFGENQRAEGNGEDKWKPIEPLTVLSPNVTSNILIQDSRVAARVADYANVVSTIPPDKVIFTQLTNELRARDIPICRGKSAIVLLSEWDTEYGRRASDALSSAIAFACDKAGHKSADGYAQVEAYSFLRGLDGAIPGSSNGGARSVVGTSPNDKPARPDTLVEWPETSDQRDYVRRLGERIAERHRESKGIQAIGIVASDTHDKLLLLQALRPKFAALPFFTTDADARLVHPAVQRWTRNLIVASGYGLYLRDELQGKTPPFRDVYQTSTYLATLLSVQEGASPLQLKTIADRWTNQVEMLEVGKTRLVQLGQTAGGSSSDRRGKAIAVSQPPCGVQSLKSCESIRDLREAPQLNSLQKAIVLGIVGGIIAAISTISFRSYRKLGGNVRLMSLNGGALLLVVLLSVVLAFSMFLTVVAVGMWSPPVSEPNLFTQGVSSLPVALCWCLALSVTIFYLQRIVTTMKPRFAKLERDFVGEVTSRVPSDTDPRRFFVFWAMSEWANRNAAPNLDTDREKFKDTWALYYYHSFSKTRPIRILAWWAIMYLIPMTALTAWLPMPTFPIRGFMHTILHVLAPAGFMSLMILIAFVADTVFICAIFVIAVGRRRNEYSEAIVGSTADHYQLLTPLRESADCILDTELIGTRTSMVADYLYYPFVVMAILAVGLFATYEHWAQWPGRFIVIGLATCEVGALWGLLRWSTERARSIALEELEMAELRALRLDAGAAGMRGAVLRQCRLLKQHIKSVRKGAYAALQDQPFVRALLLPLGGAGAAQLWQLLSSRLS